MHADDVTSLALCQVPYQLDYVRRLVDEEAAKREGHVPAQLLSQRLSSSQEASTSGQGPEAAASEPDSAQFNTDVCTLLWPLLCFLRGALCRDASCC